MFFYEVEPRFSDTDALGHINNTVYPVWFEQARTPVFRIFHPSLTPKGWPLILARMEIDLKAQCYWHTPVEVHTGIGTVGNSSFQVIQEAWQNGTVVARGVTVLIHFDYETQKSVPIPDAIRDRLAEHVFEV
ncbi:MAG: acyl-CoA thioesterase [Marinobacter sp.]